MTGHYVNQENKINKSKYIIEGYTPEILRQDPELPNIQRDAFKKVSLQRVVSPPKNKKEQDRLDNLRAVVRRNIKPLFNW